MNTYCPKCKKHTEHVVEKVKKKGRAKAHPESQAQRRFNRKLLGYGSFPRPNPRGRGKTAEKLDLRYKCKECNKKHMRGKGWRTKKFEIVKVQK